MTDIVDVKFDDDVADIFGELADLLLSKHRDYGPENIANAPGGAFNGVLVRMHDKMARLKNLAGREDEAAHEPIEDTLMDMANYAVIALMVRRGLWPGAQASKKKENVT